jgi:hypothetical protein
MDREIVDNRRDYKDLPLYHQKQISFAHGTSESHRSNKSMKGAVALNKRGTKPSYAYCQFDARKALHLNKSQRIGSSSGKFSFDNSIFSLPNRPQTSFSHRKSNHDILNVNINKIEFRPSSPSVIAMKSGTYPIKNKDSNSHENNNLSCEMDDEITFNDTSSSRPQSSSKTLHPTLSSSVEPISFAETSIDQNTAIYSPAARKKALEGLSESDLVAIKLGRQLLTKVCCVCMCVCKRERERDLIIFCPI